MRLSIAMMIKNEEKHLDECLTSLSEILNNVESELIIVDTGSTDNSVEIAKKYTDKVYFHKWNDNFSEMRNITISYCKGEWIFILDGDEVIKDSKEIIKFLNSNKRKKINAASMSVFNRTSSSDEKLGSYMTSMRIFRNDKYFKYTGSVHNQASYRLPVYEISSIIIHYGYISDDKELMEKKFKRTSKLLLKELDADPKSIHYNNQLSVTYLMHNNYELALQYSQKAYDLIQNIENKSEEVYSYLQFCLVLEHVEKYELLEKISQELLDVYKYQDSALIEFYYYLAQAKLKLKKKEEAIVNFNKYLNLIDKFEKGILPKSILTVNYNLNSKEYVYEVLVHAYAFLENSEKMMQYMYKLSDKHRILNSIGDVVITLSKTRRYKEMKEYYERVLKVKHNEAFVKEFFTFIEAFRQQSSEEEAIEFDKTFKGHDNSFEKLFDLRYGFRADEITVSQIDQFIKDENIENRDTVLREIIYMFMEKEYNVIPILNEKSYENLYEDFSYLKEQHEELKNLILKQIEKFYDINNEDIMYLDKIKFLLKYALAIPELNLNDEDYLDLFNKYVYIGITSILKLFNIKVIENEMLTEIENKNIEDVFFMYMYKVEKYKNEDIRKSIQYLSLALDSFKYMSKGIKLKINEISNINNKNQEFENYKLKLKENINILINDGYLYEAEKIANEYKEMIPDDVDIYSINAVIFIMKNKLDEAEAIIKEGITKDNNNFDLLYNLAYLYENRNNIIEALATYNKAKNLCKDAEVIELIEGKLIELGK